MQDYRIEKCRAILIPNSKTKIMMRKSKDRIVQDEVKWTIHLCVYMASG